MASIILRVQSPQHGTHRSTVSVSDTFESFIAKVKKEMNIPKDENWILYRDRKREKALMPSKAKLKSCNLSHGDMLYIFPTVEYNAESKNLSSPMEITYSGTTSPTSLPDREVVEDTVDQILSQIDGKVHRSMDPQLCHHLSSSKCIHCTSLDPWDESYLKSLTTPVKFLSFHSYIKKMASGKGKFLVLEDMSLKLKDGCEGHKPWPEGICSKCQPSAITLERQPYRHVDYVQIQNAALMDRFLNFWRISGNQRFGFLYGKYEVHPDAPLGIRASVAAIYEPPQKCARHSLELLEDPKHEIVTQVAHALGLVCVGCIFTDLLPKDTSLGTVKHYRGTIESHFLSAEEVVLAAMLQNKHPNICSASPNGRFGSKFVTVVVTGDASSNINFSGYQVSNRCMALVREGILVPTLDAPELAFIRESSNSLFVPDVFYTKTDKFGNTVKLLGRPLPVEYLLVDMPVAFPRFDIALSGDTSHSLKFNVENRESVGQAHTFEHFALYRKQFGAVESSNFFLDFHLLLYLATEDFLPVKGVAGMLLDAISRGDEQGIAAFVEKDEWQTVETLVQSTDDESSDHTHNPQLPTEGMRRSFAGEHSAPLPPIRTWSCVHCTFVNPMSATDCEVCGLPRSPT